MTRQDRIPPLGLGTWGRAGQGGRAAIGKAIEIGYRHLDTAQIYDTERQVGEAVRASGLPRGDFFVTTKAADTGLDKASFLPGVEKSIAAIGIGPVDLLLIHWPSEKNRVPLEDYVLALAEARRRGFARLIGVSNFPIALLRRTCDLLGKGAIITNQVELHPYLQAPKLAAYARAQGLALTAYLPLARGAVSRDPVLARIAQAHGATAAAVSLAFLMAEGHIVIPASGREENLRANFSARDLRLSAPDIADIRALDRGERRVNPAKSPEWDD